MTCHEEDASAEVHRRAITDPVLEVGDGPRETGVDGLARTSVEALREELLPVVPQGVGQLPEDHRVVRALAAYLLDARDCRVECRHVLLVHGDRRVVSIVGACPVQDEAELVAIPQREG
eukprot:scaffold17301_cov67-Phaeocystis_antarctica.AAC.2